MKDASRTEDWRSLCEQASKENNPQKLLDLISRINRALEESHRRSQPDQAAVMIDTVLLPRGRTSQTDFGFYRLPPQPTLNLEYDCQGDAGADAWLGQFGLKGEAAYDIRND